MNVTWTWVICLPFKIKLKEPKAEELNFKIHDIDCQLLVNHDTGLIDRIRIEIESEYSDDQLPAHEHLDYMSDIQDRMIFRVSGTIQDFVDGFSKMTDSTYYQIFDGEDFITSYEFWTSPRICNGGYNADGHEHFLGDIDVLRKSAEYANKEKGYIDNAWHLLRVSEHFIDVGNFEMAIINMATMLEYLVKVPLSKYLDNDGYFKGKKHKDIITAKYGQGRRPSFVDKFYKYGLSLITKVKLDSQTLKIVDEIYRTRDKIAHGKRLSETPLIRMYHIEPNEYKDFLEDLYESCVDVYDFFHKNFSRTSN